MNGPTLRIGRCGSNVYKKASYFAPIKLKPGGIASKNAVCMTFLNARTVEDQLTCMKDILQEYEETLSADVVDFLAQVFLEAQPKHPVKCFLTRHVTKNTGLQTPFAESLSKYLLEFTTNEHISYDNYVDEVTKLLACVENFPTGAAAFKSVQMDLAWYLINCANTCVLTLNPTKTDLSITKKNEVLDLAHLTLRLLLYIVQKLNQTEEDSSELNSISRDIMIVIKQLLVDEDLSMDAKSVAGIVLLSIYVKQNEPNSWLNVLYDDEGGDGDLCELMKNPLIRMALYSAIVNVVFVKEMQSYRIMDESDACKAVIYLASQLIKMADLYATESVLVLAVARTILQMSRMLDKLSSDIGSDLFNTFWGYIQEHLDHHMDNVQHLTAQTLDNLVVFAVKQNENGNASILNSLIADTQKMLVVRNPSSVIQMAGTFVILTALTKQLSAGEMLQKFPRLINNLLEQLYEQATLARVTTLLETLLKKHCHESSAEVVNKVWVTNMTSWVDWCVRETSATNVIENMIARAVSLQPGLMQFILELIKNYTGLSIESTLTLMTLLNGVRKAGVTNVIDEKEGHWKGLVKYEFLERCAVVLNEQARYSSLSLIVESPKTTEVFAKEDLQFVLYHLKYNINAQSPHYRQLTLSLLKKFMKRVMNSYAALKRQTEPNSDENKGQFYLEFMNDLREFCLEGLFEGANYSRRCIALQLLVWCDHFKLDGYQSVWKEDHVERLLLHLEDTYETNKKFVLEILNGCPPELLKLKTYSTSLDIKDIFEQASMLKPTECVSASYKLLLVKIKLPETICKLVETSDNDIPELETYTLIQRLLNIEACQFNNWNKGLGACSAPLYGIFRCIRTLLADVDYNLIRSSKPWQCLIQAVIHACRAATALVSAVVNDSSPEGYLPMGITECSSGETPVTAQMVLLSAWRTVKECSLLLGEIFTNCSERDGDNPDGALALNDFHDATRYFMSLLEQTQHRGAFEHAYIGFTMLLRRMWRSKSVKLCRSPRRLLERVLSRLRVRSADSTAAAQPTRRSAGLPLTIQAILMTELEVDMNLPHIQDVFSDLINTAQCDTDVTCRVHAMNTLRSLFRCGALEGAAGARVGRGAQLALRMFDSSVWAERNSATLLFSALMVRMFGVQRERERICVRNRMTGRMFFLKYPMLYNTLLEHLRAACESNDVTNLRPSLFPVLLLLSRLYPSSLEGTASHHKLSSFVTLLEICARSANAHVRVCAARAYCALVPAHASIDHIHKLLDLLYDCKMKRNHCHGVLLQLRELLGATPKETFTSLVWHELNYFKRRLVEEHWILDQLNSEKPCFIIADEYFKVLFLFAERIPIDVYDTDKTERMLRKCLEQLLTDKTERYQLYSGREMCLSNAVYNYLKVYKKYISFKSYTEFIEMCLTHTVYDVVLAALNYLSETIEKREFWNTPPEPLKHAVVNSKHPQCVDLSLELLVRLMNAATIVLIVTEEKNLTIEIVVARLIELVRKHDKPNSYLRCLFNSLYEVRDHNGFYDIVVMLFEYSTADNETATRRLVAECLENNGKKLIRSFLAQLLPNYVEYITTFWATFFVLLMDDDATIRETACRAFPTIFFEHDKPPATISTKTFESLWSLILEHDYDDNKIIYLTVFALLDFKTEVYMNDDDSDEVRVFDQNERHNIFAEEMVITNWAADKIKQFAFPLCTTRIMSAFAPQVTWNFATKLCNDHIINFTSLVRNNVAPKNAHPKVKSFFMKLVV